MRKNYLRCAVAATAMTLVFAMGAQAAVKSVTITKPTKKSSMNIYRTNKLVKKTIKVSVKKTGKSSKAVTYKTSNKSIATVTKKGVVTFKKAGTVKITATSKSNKKKKDTIKFTVVQRVSKVTAKAKSPVITVNSATAITTAVSPKNAKNKKLSFTSSNTKVATVTSKGVVKGVSAGTATITVKAVDGSKKKATVKITVNPAPTTQTPTVTTPQTSSKLFSIDTEALKEKTTYYTGVKFADTKNAAKVFDDFAAQNQNLTKLLNAEKTLGSYSVKINENGIKFFQNGKEVETVAVFDKFNEKQGEFVKAFTATTASLLPIVEANFATINGTFNFGDLIVTPKNGATVTINNVTLSKDGVSYTEAGQTYTVKLQGGKIVVNAPVGVKAEDSVVSKYLATVNTNVIK